jgi:hypothetical protein
MHLYVTTRLMKKQAVIYLVCPMTGEAEGRWEGLWTSSTLVLDMIFLPRVFGNVAAIQSVKDHRHLTKLLLWLSLLWMIKYGARSSREFLRNPLLLYLCLPVCPSLLAEPRFPLSAVHSGTVKEQGISTLELPSDPRQFATRL